MNTFTDSTKSQNTDGHHATPQYTIHRSHSNVSMSAETNAGPWHKLPDLQIDQYPWFETGKKQVTRVKACYDAQHIHLLFDCEDVHIAARARQPNGDVCIDSCVEFFASLPGQKEYFNLEINCCGDLHLGYGPDPAGRKLARPDLLKQISVVTTVQERPKRESPEDDGWTLQVRMPFQTLTQLTEQEVSPSQGDLWRANFYRCGGTTDPQYACWSPIDAPAPNFHRPDCFGVLLFADTLQS